MTDWLDDIQAQLGERTETLTDALEDLAATCGSSATGWVHHAEPEAVTVYVLASGVLHRLRGELDPLPDPDKPSALLFCACEHEAVPITDASRYSLSVTRAWRPDGDAGARVIRRWTFDHLGRFGGLVIDFPPPARTTDADPTPFARALAAAIVRAMSHSRRASDA